MSWDLIVIAILIIAVVLFFRKFSSFVYFMAILEILLRILTFIKNNIGLPDVSSLIGKYVPSSIPSLINKYTDGIICLLLEWAFVIIMGIFLGYTIRIFWKKKK